MHICNTCDTRIPKNRPLLRCSICCEIKHYKCNRLSKNDALHIISSGYGVNWICLECTYDIFRIDILDNFKVPTPSFTSTNHTHAIEITKCAACSQNCNPKKCGTCSWCNETCHIKCIKGNLGCVNCCEFLIPGYYCYSYELTSNNRAHRDEHVYNPYDHNTLINQIGDRLDDAHDTHLWNDISEKLKKCTYIEPKNTLPSKSNELNIR